MTIRRMSAAWSGSPWAVTIDRGGRVATRAQAAGAPLALVGGTLIDGFGSPPLRNSVVLVQGERITAVGQVGSLAVPAGAEVISTEGMTVLPGLWDMHVHLMINGHSDYTHWDKTYPARFEKDIMPASARQLLMAGVTSARDLGGPLEASINVRNAINRGEIPGATMYVSGPFIQHEPYPGTELFRWGVNGAADARGEGEAARRGAAWTSIKLIDQDQMTEDEVQRGHRRSARARPARRRARASAGRDSAGRAIRRRQHRAHGPGDGAGVSRRHHRRTFANAPPR